MERHTAHPGKTAYHMHYHCVPYSPLTTFYTRDGALGYLGTGPSSQQDFADVWYEYCLPLLQESELTPTGANLLDGRYAVFGYVVDGADLLQECQVGDVIEYIKVTDGGQYLKVPVPHPKSSSGTI